MARYKKSSKKSKGKNPLRYPVSPKESSPTFKDKLKVASDIIKFKPEKSIKLALIDKTQDIVDFDLGETTIVKKFGRPEDVIELHIYNLSNKILYSESNFKDYSFPEGSDATASEILIALRRAICSCNSVMIILSSTRFSMSLFEMDARCSGGKRW